MQTQHVIGICGGAVAGSEAAAMCVEAGARVVLIEQNTRPYGKIEDGLPRWHGALQRKEYGRIDQNLRLPGVTFVPRTRLGHDVSYAQLRDQLGLSALILATGAWRDRPLPIEGIDRFVDKGLVYQNPFVYWFNHYHEPGYDGPRFEIHDGAVVVGGGLASIDVAKIINLELYARALRERGIDVDVVEMEHAGIDKTLAAHGLTADELGVAGCVLCYRRRAEDMPLASADNPTPERMAKLRKARVKILDKVMRKYLVRFQPQVLPLAPVVEGERMVGITLQRTRLEGRKVIPIEGDVVTLHSDLVVSSIGSIPEAIEGLPMRGELYAFESWDTGALDEAASVYGLGNVLTGKGNIVASRKNAREITTNVVLARLGLGDASDVAEAVEEAHQAAREQMAPVVERALRGAIPDPAAGPRLDGWVATRWNAAGYDGDYDAWIAASWPR